MTQQNPKTVLAYSSVSQMGLIAAVLGMGLASANQGVAADAAFYGVNHVFVKAGLFLTVGVVAARSGRGRTLALIVGGLLALSLAGLPLTGGALAKLAVKGPFGDGPAKWAAAASAAATAALMLHFVMRLARSPHDEGNASPERVWSWLSLAALSVLVPWLMFPAAGGDVADALAEGPLWDATWPMLVGAALFAGLWALGDPLPRIPAGDILGVEEAAFRGSAPLGVLIERLDGRLRQWPAAGMALLAIVLILAAAGFAGR